MVKMVGFGLDERASLDRFHDHLLLPLVYPRGRGRRYREMSVVTLGGKGRAEPLGPTEPLQHPDHPLLGNRRVRRAVMTL